MKKYNIPDDINEELIERYINWLVNEKKSVNPSSKMKCNYLLKMYII